jgi:uncharacterized membrane protein YkvA (DUF1232 family)
MSKQSFVHFLFENLRAIGTKTAALAFTLWFAMNDPATPVWAKTTILAAIGYLAMPADAVPDLLPGVGFGDDAAALASALWIVAAHVKPEHSERGRAQVATLFGA